MVKVWKSRARELVHDGPAGTGKSRGIIELCHLAAMKYPNARIVWAMKRRVTMNKTILTTFEKHVLPPGSPLLRGPTKEHRTSYVYPNGSEILLVGLDEPENTRGLEADWIIEFEATNITEDAHEILLRCLRWSGIPYRRVICDTNPGVPQHWLLQRVTRGSMERIPASHRDNPRYWDARKGRYTPEGEEYIEGTLGAMTGSRRARLKDGLWVGDDSSVFDLDVLLKHRNKYGEEPWHVGSIVCTEEHPKTRDRLLKRRDRAIVRWQEGAPGMIAGRAGCEWKLWCDLFPDSKTGGFRPDQAFLPVIFGDVSWGQGASNSILCVGDRITGRKIAEFASANMPPEELGRLIVMAGLWFGGVRGYAFAGWEYNGAGKSVTKIAAHTLAYPWCYEHKSRKRGLAESTGKKAVVGWVSSREAKIDLALELRDGYAQEDFINPSTSAIDETMGWIRYPDGGIGPAAMIDESPEARQTHGDRTIGDMGLWHMMQVCPMYAIKGPAAEPGSIADRAEEVGEDDPEDDG